MFLYQVWNELLCMLDAGTTFEGTNLEGLAAGIPRLQQDTR